MAEKASPAAHIAQRGLPFLTTIKTYTPPTYSTVMASRMAGLLQKLQAKVPHQLLSQK
jgi:hypothetical protein